MSNDQWLEEARARAASKHGAKQLRFLAPDDEDPKDPDIILVPVGGKVEGVVIDLSELDGQFGPTTLATIDDQEYGVVKILCGPKILADLIAVANVGDFISAEWNGKRQTKDGSSSYRHWSVVHYPAPGSTPNPTPQSTYSSPQQTYSNQSSVTLGDDADLDDPL